MTAFKFTKKKDYEGTLRKVWTDDKSRCLGLVGTVSELLEVGVLESCTNYSRDTWCCIPTVGYDTGVGFGASRDEAIRNAILPK